jgi:Transposase domain (DUF772)
MYKTTKSPRKVLLVAHAVAVQCLPSYSHLFSPQKFTLHQLFAILVLKEFMRCDYRKVAALLEDCAELREAIGLKTVPHFTTIQKASARLLQSKPARLLLQSTLKLARKKSCSRHD